MATHDEVAHAWANKQDRHHKGYAMFTGSISGLGTGEHDTIFSHGYHFPIARWTVDAHGRECILFTTETYSVSTTQHCQHVTRAIAESVTVYPVPKVAASTKQDHKDNYNYMRHQITKHLSSAARRRVDVYAQMDIGEAELWRSRANAYTKAFKLGFKQIPQNPNVVAVLEEYKRKEREEQQKRDKEARAGVRKWLAFEIDRCPHTTHPYVRILKDKGVVQTSWGASVPLDDAIEAHKLALTCRAMKQDYSPDHAQHVGHYPLEKVSSNGDLRIGCHLLPFKVQRLALDHAGIDVHADAPKAGE